MLIGYNIEVVYVEFSFDSKYVVIVFCYGFVCLWKVESGELVVVLNGSKYVVFSFDGRKLVIILFEIVYLWDVNIG